MKVIDLCQWCRFVISDGYWIAKNWETPLVIVTYGGWWTAQVFTTDANGQLVDKSLCGRAARPASAA